MTAGGPRLVAASIIGPEVLAGAGPFGLHGILVFDRILDGQSAAVATRFVIPNNSVRSAKAVLSGRLVVVISGSPRAPMSRPPSAWTGSLTFAAGGEGAAPRSGRASSIQARWSPGASWAPTEPR